MTCEKVWDNNNFYLKFRKKSRLIIACLNIYDYNDDVVIKILFGNKNERKNGNERPVQCSIQKSLKWNK